MEYSNPFNEQCDVFSKSFDAAIDTQDWDKTQKIIAEAEHYITEHSTAQYAPIFYSVATAYSDIAKCKPEYMTDAIQEKTLYYFRTALNLLNSHELKNPEFKPYVLGLQLPLLTNYANALSRCGRKIASIRYYRQVLQISPKFSMAKGNIGIDLLSYSRFVYDPGHQDYLGYFSYHYLKSAVEDSDETIHPDAKQYFTQILNGYSQNYIEEFLEKPLDIPEYSLGDSNEYAYRMWCLNNHLFLNPLNDLPLEHSCFAADTLKLPDLTTNISRTDVPIFYGIFNQLKQEYVYARYLCYKGCSFQDAPHYADKETCLVDLLDFPQYSIRIEDTKTAFRLLYSLFDKVAFFINSYYNLEIKERDITFHSIWRQASGYGKSRYKHKSLHDVNPNVGIDSLRWMYKDFNDIFGDAHSPQQEHMNILRNALEHKYVKVHDCLLYDMAAPYIDEEMTYHISETDLENYTLDLMYMVRELIIDLTMAVHAHEKDKLSKLSKKRLVTQVNLFDYDDTWKI